MATPMTTSTATAPARKAGCLRRRAPLEVLPARVSRVSSIFSRNGSPGLKKSSNCSLPVVEGDLRGERVLEGRVGADQARGLLHLGILQCGIAGPVAFGKGLRFLDVHGCSLPSDAAAACPPASICCPRRRGRNRLRRQGPQWRFAKSARSPATEKQLIYRSASALRPGSGSLEKRSAISSAAGSEASEGGGAVRGFSGADPTAWGDWFRRRLRTFAHQPMLRSFCRCGNDEFSRRRRKGLRAWRLARPAVRRSRARRNGRCP